MTIQIDEITALDAWKAGCRAILSSQSKDVFNMVTTIANPVFFEDDWLIEFNPKRVNKNASSLSDVVNTIFPYRLYNPDLNNQSFYSRYKARHSKAQKIHTRTKKSWGTYFGRLIGFGRDEINQLEQVINTLNARTRNYTASLVMHTSSADTDSLIKTRGNPCLQFIEILCPTANTITLLVVYRNHDYFNKAFGNFIGLGKLLQFICDQTGRVPCSIVCHSAHAYFECSKNEIVRLARLA